MKSGSCARNRKRRANERGGTPPSADGYYRSLPPALSQLDARYFRRPSSFGQFHRTGDSFSLSSSLFGQASCHAKRTSPENAPRKDTPHHYLPGEMLTRSLMKRESRGNGPHLRSCVTYSSESSLHTRALAHGFIVRDARRIITFNYLSDPLVAFVIPRCTVSSPETTS